jgi:hypothetical protein
MKSGSSWDHQSPTDGFDDWIEWWSKYAIILLHCWDWMNSARDFRRVWQFCKAALFRWDSNLPDHCQLSAGIMEKSYKLIRSRPLTGIWYWDYGFIETISTSSSNSRSLVR